MFFGKAKQLCPSLQSVPYDFEAYKEVAINMYEILARWEGAEFCLSLLCLCNIKTPKFCFLALHSYTRDIEALSCDEALIDGSALLAELGISPDDLAQAIRADIKEKTGCSASVGMGEPCLPRGF